MRFPNQTEKNMWVKWFWDADDYILTYTKLADITVSIKSEKYI